MEHIQLNIQFSCSFYNFIFMPDDFTVILE